MKTSRPIKLVAENFSFLESPRWHDDHLYFSDFYRHTVHRTDASHRLETICHVPQQPSGIGFTPAGELMVVSMLDRKVVKLVEGSLETFADLNDVAPFHCNDMLVDKKGRAYVGNFGWDTGNSEVIQPTRLALLQADGKITVAADDLIFPNGLALTADGRTLMAAETFAARVSAFDVADDGSLSNRRTWASFTEQRFTTLPEAIGSGALLADGMALDAEGAIWIADAIGHGIARVAEGGKILDFIDTGDLSVYAATLGGRDRRTLYMCVSPPLPHDPVTDPRSSLLSCYVDIPGAGLP